MEALGGRALALPTGVSDAAAVERAAAAVEAAFGPIDIWINNAMISVFSPVRQMKPDEYKRVTEVTYLGVVYGTLAALSRMLPRDRGVIVQVGSALAYRGIPLQSAYCGAKHAIQGFVDSLRTELMHDESAVRVTMVQMPAMNTPQFSWVKSRLPNEPQPVPPIYQPEIGAEAVHFAAHHDRREMYVGYPTIGAIAGNKVSPSFADWYLARSGYQSQQTAHPVAADRRDNLWEPVPGDHGAHGSFDDRAARSSPLLWGQYESRRARNGRGRRRWTGARDSLAPRDMSPSLLGAILVGALLAGFAAGWMGGRALRWTMPNVLTATAVLIAGFAAGLTFWPMGDTQSAWPQRVPIAILALIGFGIATG